MKKKGQITVFIIVGIVMLMSFSIMLLIRGQFGDKEEDITKVDTSNIRNFIEGCVQQTARQSLFYFGFIGGDVAPDPWAEYYIYDDFYKIPFYYHQGKNNMPSKTTVERDILAQYIDTKLHRCIGNFEAFKDFEVSYKQPFTNVDINDDFVLFKTNFEVTTRRDGESTKILPNYLVTIPLQLNNMLTITGRVIDMAVADDGIVPWSFLTDSNDENLNVTAYMDFNKNIIYRMTDKRNDLFGKRYVYQFAVKVK